MDLTKLGRFITKWEKYWPRKCSTNFITKGSQKKGGKVLPRSISKMGKILAQEVQYNFFTKRQLK